MIEVVGAKLRLVFFYIGICILLSYNFVLASLAVFEKRLGAKFYGQYLPLVSITAVNIVKAVMLYRGEKTPYIVAFFAAGAAQPIATCGISLFSYYFGTGGSNENEDVGLAFFIILVFVVGFTGAILDIMAFMMASESSGELMKYLLLGIPAGGIVQYPLQRFVQYLLILGKENGELNNQDLAFRDVILFTLGAVATTLLVPVYFLLKRNPITANSISRLKSNPVLDNEKQKTDNIPEAVSVTEKSKWVLTKQLAPMTGSVAAIYIVTFIVFPGIFLKWETVGSGGNVQMLSDLIFVFVIGDFVGRILVMFPRLVVSNIKVIIGFAVSRLAFVPIFLLVALIPDNKVLSDEYFKGLTMFLFAVSNGYGSGVAFVKGPSLVGEIDAEKNFAGSSLSSFLTMGILIGSIVGLTIQAMIW